LELFLRNLAQDPERMRKTYQQLVNDPEFKELIEEIRNNLRSKEMKEGNY